MTPSSLNSPSPARRLSRRLSWGMLGGLLIAALVAYPKLHASLTRQQPVAASAAPPVATLVEGSKNTLRVEKSLVERLGIQTAAAVAATIPQTLKLNGSLTLDAQSMQEVRSQFTGEVVEIGKTDSGKELEYGDTVKQGQLLAVLWSRELGEKKSELIDALSQLHLDTDTLTRLKAIVKEGAIPERQYREIERSVEGDRITVAKVTRTLQTWRVTDEELDAVQSEAQRLIAGELELSDKQKEFWARVEIRAKMDGVLLERNLTTGDIVTNADTLFKIGNLSRLRVLAYAYEENLPALDALPVDQRRWTLTLPSDPNYPGSASRFEQIGHIIDPAQHTALVMGWVDNQDGRLRAGQFIMASVELPSPGNEVSVPASAVIEKGRASLIFVQKGSEPVFTQRSVSVSRQVDGNACIRIAPSTTPGHLSLDGLQPGERVVTSGVIELQQALVDLAIESPSTGNSAEKSH